jgi:hypothetical protein
MEIHYQPGMAVRAIGNVAFGTAKAFGLLALNETRSVVGQFLGREDATPAIAPPNDAVPDAPIIDATSVVVDPPSTEPEAPAQEDGPSMADVLGDVDNCVEEVERISVRLLVIAAAIALVVGGLTRNEACTVIAYFFGERLSALARRPAPKPD